jgi:hypothetical protein
MYDVNFRFYGELNDLLQTENRQVLYSFDLMSQSSVKDAVEAQGIPHTEVALLLVNGDSVDWDIKLKDGDQISVYPEMFQFNPAEDSKVYNPVAVPLKFILDVHLGKLAAYLRMLGFDTLYFKQNITDSELVGFAIKEKRVLLTMDRKLLMFKKLQWGSIVRNRKPRDQVPEILDRYNCREEINPFSRCMLCNVQLEQADEELVSLKVPPRVLQRRKETGFDILKCGGCEKLYWHGTHWEHMKRLMESWGMGTS